MSDDNNNSSGPCEVCQTISSQKCSGCKQVFYCSSDHQKENWKVHKEECRAYEVRHSKDLGRYLVAKRDLEPGDVIFIDTPLVYGPKHNKIEDGPFPCVGCGKFLEPNELRQCPECFWPACNPNCEGLKNQAIHGCECQVLKMRPFQGENKSPYEYFRFDVLIMLRSLFLQKIDKKKWNTLLNLEDHLDERGPGTPVFGTIQEKVDIIIEHFIKPLKDFEQANNQTILPQVSSDIIHKIYGIFEVNATELTDSADMEILYPIASLPEHNCTPNTVQVIDEKDNYRVTFRAALPIKKGENITSCYTDILRGTQERRKYLKETKYFSCVCERCRDPTEFGTNFSGLICLGTETEPCQGLQLPQNPTNDSVKWLCNKCGLKLPNEEIMKFMGHLSDEVDKQLSKKPKMEELEEFLNKLLIFLHPHHYLVYAVKHSLVQLYRSDGDVQISNEYLKEKLKICEELIEITKKIDPGNSRLSLYLSVLLNEQFEGKFTILNREFSSEDREESRSLVNEILEIIKENKKVLCYEKTSSAGQKMFNVVGVSEIRFKNWLQENLMDSDTV